MSPDPASSNRLGSAGEWCHRDLCGHGSYLLLVPPAVQLSYHCLSGGFRRASGDAVLLNGGALYRIQGPFGEEKRYLQASFADGAYRRAQSAGGLEGGLSIQEKLDILTAVGELQIRQSDGALIGGATRLSLRGEEDCITLLDQDGTVLAIRDSESEGLWHSGGEQLQLAYSRILWIAPKAYFSLTVDTPQLGPRSRLSALAAGAAIPTFALSGVAR